MICLKLHGQLVRGGVGRNSSLTSLICLLHMHIQDRSDTHTHTACISTRAYLRHALCSVQSKISECVCVCVWEDMEIDGKLVTRSRLPHRIR